MIEVKLSDVMPVSAGSHIEKPATDLDAQKRGERFNYLTKDIDNWKMPFRATIPAAEMCEYQDAASFFAGSPLEIIRVYLSEGIEYYEVEGAGYYNCIGA